MAAARKGDDADAGSEARRCHEVDVRASFGRDVDLRGDARDAEHTCRSTCNSGYCGVTW